MTIGGNKLNKQLPTIPLDGFEQFELWLLTEFFGQSSIAHDVPVAPFRKDDGLLGCTKDACIDVLLGLQY